VQRPAGLSRFRDSPGSGPRVAARIAEEPTTALDLTVQALCIAHDLSVVRHIRGRTAVMYLGTTVEMADRTGMYEHPLHPYTPALLSAVPVPDPVKQHRRERILSRGDPRPRSTRSAAAGFTHVAGRPRKCARPWSPSWSRSSRATWPRVTSPEERELV